MISPLNKSQRQKPKFPFSADRAPPDLSLIDAPRPAARPVRTVSVAAQKEAQRVKNHLCAIRSAKTSDRRLDGVLLLSSISVEAGTTFFHLTDEARGVLNDGFGLPWGA